MVGRAARMRVSSATAPVLERHVEVDAHEHALARERVVGDANASWRFSLPAGLRVRGPSATRSTRRHE